jgi:manganese efflux pump family protein
MTAPSTQGGDAPDERRGRRRMAHGIGRAQVLKHRLSGRHFVLLVPRFVLPYAGMSFLAIIFVAVALAMDAFAVSIASGITIRNLKVHHALTIAAWFGFFQSLMPFLGWLGGVTLKSYVTGFDHWVIWGLLCFVGGKMIYEVTVIERAEEKTNPLDIDVLFFLSIATSLDAVAAGISFALMSVSIATPALTIGVITFAMCFCGVLIGKKFGHFFEKKIEVVGGLILIVLGFKILISHLLGG